MPPLSRGSRFLTRQGLPRFLHVPLRNASTRSKLFVVSEEVEQAIAIGRPVVALETTIYTHGYPYPDNVALASRLESLIRTNGGVPATIGIVDGQAQVGMSADELIRLVSTAGSKDTWKISRRDLGFIGGLGIRGKNYHGGTTIAGTMILAHLAGIKVFATGGLGGVHKGGENSMDISADLTELGRTPVAVISSGCKSFLDIPRTLEYLETQGVGVATFADSRAGNVDFPAFFSRDSGVRSPRVLENEADAAAVIHAQFQLPLHSGLLFANPVPVEASIARNEIDSIMEQAVAEADSQGIHGSANTPYVLKRIRELSNNASVVANTALIEANVIRGTKVAVELAKLENQDRMDATAKREVSANNEIHIPTYSTISTQTTTQSQKIDKPLVPTELPGQADILVAGSLACDTICDYTPLHQAVTTEKPTLHTSNPASISQSMGGVGRNVATAAYYAGARVALASVVADDIAGLSLQEQLTRTGLTNSYIRQLRTVDGARTAQYVAMNDLKKDLVVAMADMSILTRPELQGTEYWSSIMDKVKPKWVVVDGNWSAKIIATIVGAAKLAKIPVAFEPVSTAKSSRIFENTANCITDTTVVPNHCINLATPNLFELKAMHDAAQERGLFESEQWWLTIDSMGMSSSGSRDRFVTMTNSKLVNQGVPQQSIRLLPYIPTIITKLGSRGCLLTTLLKRGDERLTDPISAPYILSRTNSESNPSVGGVYMRLFPASEEVPQDQILSVNGVGDTLLGTLMAGLVKKEPAAKKVEDIIPLAQRAAILTLKSKEAVAPELSSLKSLL